MAVQLRLNSVSPLKALAVVVITILAGGVFACLWDDDTLADEVKNERDFIDAVSGRFDLNPPLYYEMRLAAAQKRLAAEPRNWDIYDNIGVAQEKLGHPEQAASIMEEKWVRLEPLWKQQGKSLNDAAYRTQANWGTFMVHSYFKSKAASGTAITEKRGSTLLEDSLKHLNEAIKINPNAHFGREVVQIKIIEWYRASTVDSSYFGVDPQEFRKFALKNGLGRTEQGIIGMMNFGSGWDSPDMMILLCWIQAMKKNASAQRLGALRVNDLIAQGKKCLLFMDPRSSTHRISAGSPSADEPLMPEYAHYKANGIRYRDHRTEYMLERLKTGKHPDWDPTFWSAYVPEPKPKPKFSRPRSLFYKPTGADKAIATAAGLSTLAILAFIFKARKDRLARQ